MPNSQEVPFDDLPSADLVLDRVYRGGSRGNAGDDALGALLPVGNQGGFRYCGSVKGGTVKLVALYSTGAEVDWPDRVDPVTGDFTYYGDNRRPGSQLHETQRSGNLLLREMFALARGDASAREQVPPTLLFERATPGRSVLFRGLLAPGAPRLTAEEELVAVWRTTQDRRFQNYRSHFTVLRTPLVTRQWIRDILAGNPLSEACPGEWMKWVRGRIFLPLEAPRTLLVRSRSEQLPAENDMWLLLCVYEHFRPDPIAFERFAADLWLHSDPNVVSVEVTRPSRDGGRDAVGEYRLGPTSDPIKLSFALEAKCLEPSRAGVNVRMVSRLISRIKHREFGILVTTAHMGIQPYQEIREDGHPIVVFAGRDIVDQLKRRGYSTREALRKFLELEFPVESNDRALGLVDIVHEPGLKSAGLSSFVSDSGLVDGVALPPSQASRQP